MESVNRFKAAVSAALGLLTALWGWFGWLVVAWIACMAMDVFTGMAASCKNGEWSSKVARAGLWHKIGCVAAVLIAGVLDLVVGQLVENVGANLPFTYAVLLCPLAVTWYILTEAGSIIENAGKLGAPIPAWLRKWVASLRDVVDTAGDGAAPRDK